MNINSFFQQPTVQLNFEDKFVPGGKYIPGGLEKNIPPDKMHFLHNRARLSYLNFLIYMGEISLQFL